MSVSAPADPGPGRAPRSRFYDGRVYARTLDRFLARLHQLVADRVGTTGRVLDVGCGTGDLAWRLADNADEVVGVELSRAMVDFANQEREARGHRGVSFLLGDAVRVLGELPEDHFDTATMVLVLHEMPAGVWAPALRQITRVSRQLLCVDFRAPMPWNLAGLRNRFFEVTAGAEHFRAFRNYQRRGGLPAATREAGLVYELVRPVDAKTMEMAWVTRRA